MGIRCVPVNETHFKDCRVAADQLLGGAEGGPAASNATMTLLIPSRKVARIQEMHALVIHLLCERIDAWATSVEDPPMR